GLPAVTLGPVVQRSYRDANPTTLQSYVDAVTEAIARVRSDRALATPLPKSNMNIESDEDLIVTYDYFSGLQLLPSLPYLRPEQFSDTITVLGQADERLTKLDVPSLLDSSFVKSAEDRGLGK